jgi:hypothetical protein
VQNLNVVGSSPDSDSGSGSLSLAFVPLANCRFQEAIDPRRAEKTIHLLKSEGILRNPISGCHLDGAAWTAWDGANRTVALKHLGFRSTLIQNIPPENISAGTWILAVVRPHRLLPSLINRGLIVSACDRLADVDQPSIVGQLRSASGFYLIKRPERLGRVAATQVVTTTLIESTDQAIRRHDSSYWDEHTDTDSPETLVRFSRLMPDEVLSAVAYGEQVGSGVTRWRFARRIVAVNVPLGLLKQSPADLNKHLSEIVQSAAVREYTDSIVQEVAISWIA